jgi:phospholipid transport system substrate-binding protein
MANPRQTRAPVDFVQAGGSDRTRITRRAALAVAVAGTGMMWPIPRPRADAVAADAIVAIGMLNTPLLASTSAGGSAAFSSRYAAMEPTIDQTFDLTIVLAVSVGVRCGALAPDQQSRLLTAFRRYTVVSCVANFDTHAGQSFAVSPQARSAGDGRTIVESRIAPVSGEATKFGYVMTQTPSGWKIVDVLEDGAISRVAIRRFDFRAVLASAAAPVA